MVHGRKKYRRLSALCRCAFKPMTSHITQCHTLDFLFLLLSASLPQHPLETGVCSRIYFVLCAFFAVVVRVVFFIPGPQRSLGVRTLWTPRSRVRGRPLLILRMLNTVPFPHLQTQTSTFRPVFHFPSREDNISLSLSDIDVVPIMATMPRVHLPPRRKGVRIPSFLLKMSPVVMAEDGSPLTWQNWRFLVRPLPKPKWRK